MTGVLIGFAIIGAVILIGYVVGRMDILGPAGRTVLARITFFVLSPCLLLTVLADADVQVLFSSLLVVSLIAAVAMMLVYALVAALVWRRRVPETVIGSLASGYVNANNIGIPVAVYVIGDAAYSAPVILIQLLLFAPVGLALLDLSTSGAVSVKRVLLQPVRNPIVLGAALGLGIALLPFEVPTELLEPFRLIGAAAIPLVLISFGMSLHGQRVLEPGSGRRDVVLATALKLLAMPLVAWAVGRFVFGLEGEPLFAVTVLAALPSAQNVFNYAQRYERGEVISRDTILLTTIGAVPVLLVVAALLS